jgi:hypothetical protein
VAGLLEGASEGELDEPLARQAAGLCRKAGADPEAIPAWVEEGGREGAPAWSAAWTAAAASCCSDLASATRLVRGWLRLSYRHVASQSGNLPGSE